MFHVLLKMLIYQILLLKIITLNSIAVGSPCIRNRLQRPLDSYQVRATTNINIITAITTITIILIIIITTLAE